MAPGEFFPPLSSSSSILFFLRPTSRGTSIATEEEGKRALRVCLQDRGSNISPPPLVPEWSLSFFSLLPTDEGTDRQGSEEEGKGPPNWKWGPSPPSDVDMAGGSKTKKEGIVAERTSHYHNKYVRIISTFFAFRPPSSTYSAIIELSPNEFTRRWRQKNLFFPLGHSRNCLLFPLLFPLRCVVSFLPPIFPGNA